MEYQYTDKQINEILQKIIAKARHELQIAQENGTVEDLMDDYGVKLEANPMPVNPRLSKILVVGALAGKQNDYIMSARKLNINENNIEFETDYSKMNNLSLTKLKYSDVYSDVIFGPIPHSMIGKDDSSSIIALMEKESDKYPRVIRASANNELKLTITSFRKSLRETRYFENII